MPKTVTLFHGSSRKFNAFEIDPVHTISKISDLQEGVGIYMSEDPNLPVTSKWPILYEVEVAKEETADFMDVKVINDYLKKVNNDTAALIKADILDYFDKTKLAKEILNGGAVITKLYDAIRDYLDNSEVFHSDFAEFLEDEDADNYVFTHIERSCKMHLKDVFRYYDRSFDCPIWICINNPDKLQIVSILEDEDEE